MALTKAHNRMIAGSYVNVLDYGAVGDGDLEYDAVASGAGTLDVFMSVTEMKY